MRRAHWKLAPLAVAGLAAAVLAGSATALAAPTVGPCLPPLPPGVKLPPGVPKLPSCQKKPTKSSYEVKVDGSVAVAFTSHTGNWGQCTPAQGGGAHTDASTVLDFGQPTWEPVTPGFGTGKGEKGKVVERLTKLDASPTVEMTLQPKQDQRHEVPPGCQAQKDPTGCSETKATGSVTVHVNADQDLVRVTLGPPRTLSAALCAAPFTSGDNLFDDLSFKHELDELDKGLLAFLGTSKGKGVTKTIAWDDPKAPCSEYGGPKAGSGNPFGGTIESCTVKADFRIEIRHLG